MPREAYQRKNTLALSAWTRPQLSPHLLSLLLDPAAAGDGSVWTPGDTGQRIAEVQVSASLIGVTWMGILSGRSDDRFSNLRDRVLKLLHERARGRTVAIKE